MIEASATTIARVLASLDGSDATIAPVVHVGGPAPAAIGMTGTPAPQPVAVSSDDDETSDADAAPGSLDKNGLPWDDRIHSTPAKLTTKGVWRAKRNVHDGLVAQVEAELRARVGGVPTPAASTAPQPQATPVMPQPVAAPAPVPAPQPGFVPPVTYPPVPTGAPAPQAMPPQPQPVATPAPAPAPAAPTVAAPLDFNGFMQKISQLMTLKNHDGSLFVDAAYFGSVCERVSKAFQLPQPLTAITDLSANQDWVNYAIQLMQYDQKWQ